MAIYTKHERPVHKQEQELQFTIQEVSRPEALFGWQHSLQQSRKVVDTPYATSESEELAEPSARRTVLLKLGSISVF